MPSASNNINNNKLEKQSSISAGGGNAAPGGQTQNAGGASKTENLGAANIALNNNNSESNSNISVTKERGSNAGIVNETFNPMKQSCIAIEHKIRNLEKRKTKLEFYRNMQSRGIELSIDQKAAVDKYDAVIATLDFARDFAKQMLQFTKEAEKEQKKQARKEVMQRAQAETAKIREVLTIQNILTCFLDSSIRSDFLNGVNGAVKLESSDLYALSKFYVDVQTARPETTEDTSFVTIAQKAAEYFSMTIDGRPKQYGETTFENMRRIFNQINECGYLDKIYMTFPEGGPDNTEEELSATRENINDDVNNIGEEKSVDEVVEKVNLNETGEVTVDKTQQQTQQGMMMNLDGGNVLLPPPIQQQQLQLNTHKSPIDLQQQQQAPHGKEQLDITQQPIVQMNATAMPLQSQQQTGIQAPPASAVPNFQPQPPSGTNTPVHVTMFTGQQLPGGPPPPALQQVPPGGIISVSQGPPPQLVGPPPQQRQLVTSPAGAIALHNAPPPPPPGHYPPTTVRAVEQSFFKQHQHQQYLQQIRPLAEVIGGGSFYFLQDSELDSPDNNMGATAAAVAVGSGGVGPPVTSSAVAGVVFEPQQSSNQQLGHAELANQVELQQKTIDPQQSQPIATQTFTNQSFPPMQAVQQQQQAAGNNTPSLTGNNNSNAPSPMFQTKVTGQPQQQQHLFSPVAGLSQQPQLLQPQQPDTTNAAPSQTSQLVLNEVAQQQQQQDQQPPMMIMARLTTPQARLPSQPISAQTVPQPQPTTPQLAIQTIEVTNAPAVAGGGAFVFENASITYEQQMQQQLAAATAVNSANVGTIVVVDKEEGADSEREPVPELKHVLSRANAVALAQSNATATVALTNALKPTNSSVIDSNKWSATTAVSGGDSSSSTGSQLPSQLRKNEWTSSGGGGNSGIGGSNNSGVRGNYQRHERDERGGGRSAGGYRGRPNYSGGGSGSAQQNSKSGGMYFRNNENSSSGGSSYYQNGGGGGAGAGSYRGPRGGSGSTRGTGPTRSMSGRNGDAGRGGSESGRGGGSNSMDTYMNTRTSSNRNSMPPSAVGLNKN